MDKLKGFRKNLGKSTSDRDASNCSGVEQAEDGKLCKDEVPVVTTGEDESYIQSLPNELLEYIFSFLTIVQRIQIERVCKRWRDIGKVWQYPTKLFIDNFHSPAECDENFPFNVFYYMVVYVPRSCYLSTYGVSRLAVSSLAACPPAGHKPLRKKRGDDPEKRRNVMSPILSRSGISLKELTLGLQETENMCEEQQDRSFAARLHNLFTSGRGNPSDNSKCWMSTESLEIIAKSCPNLVQLRLHHCSIVELYYFMIDRLPILEEGCNSLKIIKLHGQFKIKSNPGEELEYGNHLNAVAYMNILKGERFDRVSLGVCVLQQCFVVCGDYFNSGACGCQSVEEPLQRQSKSEDNDVFDFCHQYKDTLKFLSLQLYTHDTFSNEQRTLLLKLQELNVYGKRSVNDKVCQTLVQNCPNLKKLNISATSVSDAGLGYLASAEHLVDVDVSWTDINGDGIEKLASSGRLEILLARSCEQIMDSSRCFYSVIRLSPNLQLLAVTETNSISKEFLDSCTVSVQDGHFKGPLSLVLDESVTKGMVLCAGKLQIHNSLDEYIRYAHCHDYYYRYSVLNSEGK